MLIAQPQLKASVIRLMITFEVIVNGQSFAVAGADDLSVLTAIVSAVGKLGTTSKGAYQCEDYHHIELRIGGLTSRAEGLPDEHLDWSEHTLKPGDVITIRVADATSADVPTKSKPAHTDDDYKQQFEWAKNFYFENRDKFDDG